MSDTINIDTETTWLEELDMDVLHLLNVLDDCDSCLEGMDLWARYS